MCNFSVNCYNMNIFQEVVVSIVEPVGRAAHCVQSVKLHHWAHFPSSQRSPGAASAVSQQASPRDERGWRRGAAAAPRATPRGVACDSSVECESCAV